MGIHELPPGGPSFSPHPRRVSSQWKSTRGEKVRDVARKLITKRTEVHIEQYVDQVSIALRRHLARLDIPVDEQERQLSDFWITVNLEAARISHHATRDNNPKGAA